MVSEMRRRFQAEEEAASVRVHQLMKLTESRESQYREELAQQGEVYKRVLDGNARQSNATKDQQIQALKDHYERQNETRRVQLSQLESIIQQQSEQIKAQQLQAESMNMRLGKLLNTLGPLPVPVVQTATAALPPATEVKMSAPLSSFASASASKPVSANQDLWETIGQEGGGGGAGGGGYQVPRLPRKVPRRHRRPKRAQARHQSQPSAASATPATQNASQRRQVPRLPRTMQVSVAK